MSLSSQATNKPTSSNANHAAVKWNDFAAKQFEKHSKSRTRHRNHIPPRYPERQRQQQPTLYSPPLPPSPSPFLSPNTTNTTIPSTTTSSSIPPIQKQPVPSHQQKPINDSTQSWQNFARQQSKASANNNNDNGVATTLQRQNTSTPFQSQNNNNNNNSNNSNNTCSATPRKSVSENVRRERYHYDNNNNIHYNNNNNNNSYYYYNNKIAPTTPTATTTAKMGTSSFSSYPSYPSSRTNMSTSSIPTRRFRSTLNDPPLCFCNKLASERKIPHDGIIYECHWLQDTMDDKKQLPSSSASLVSSSSSSSTTTTTTTTITDKSICAFHVHKNFWDICRQNLRDGRPIDKLDRSLASCPEFNLTFSIVLPQQRNNTFTKSIPYTPPNCFCNRPARLFDDSIRYHQARPFFACKELDAGDPPIRCGFFTFIENARFKLPEYSIHSRLQVQAGDTGYPVSSPTVSFSSTSDRSSSSQQQQPGYHRRYRYQHYDSANNNSDWPPSPHESVCSTATATSFRVNPDEDETIYNPQQQHTSDHLELLLRASSANRKSTIQSSSVQINDDNNESGELGGSGSRGEKEGIENDNDDATMTANNAHFIQVLREAKISSFLRGTSSTHDNNENDNEHNAALLSCIMQGNDDLSTRNNSPFSSGSSYNGIGSSTPGSYGSLIPSAVYTRHAINKKTAMDAQTLLEERKTGELRQQIQELEETIIQLKQEIDQQREINEKKQYELSKLKEKEEQRRNHGELLIRQAEELMAEKEAIVNSMDEIRQILKEEIEIRQKSQSRQRELEEMTQEVIHINEILSHEMAEKEDNLSMKDLKCRVCFQENIEFALVPCYHCSYCKSCAEKLTECAICREAKYAIQKIYIS